MRASLSRILHSVQQARLRTAPLRVRFALLGALVLATTSGCASLGYYAQAAAGEFALWRDARSIDTLLARGDLAPALCAKLELVTAARRFAAAELALPDHGSYRSYVALDRDYVVWNVFAAPEFDLALRQSCFPIVGCVEYRGYFARAAAERHADAQRAAGDDVYVGGVAAYSTLGWFNDPVPSSMLSWNDARIVDTLFHELAHQVVFVAGDTPFNESFAMAVARAGTARWFAAEPARGHASQAERAREDALVNLVLEYRDRLAVLYAGPLATREKRAAKAALFAELRERHAGLKAAWGGDSAYDEWMSRDLNNAKLGTVAAYHGGIEAFTALLRACGDDLPRFYTAVARLGREAPNVRTAWLRGSARPAPAGCLGEAAR